MRSCQNRLLTFISPLFLLHIPISSAGLNQFTEIDSYKEWIIEQKFSLKNNTISCRASRLGYGTWFGERIRLGKNGKVLFPEGTSIEKQPSAKDLQAIQSALEKCNSGLLYFR